MLCDRLIPDIYCCDSHRHNSYLTLICIHLILALPCFSLDIWHRYLPCLSLDIDTGTCHAILIIWYRHRYLPCYTYYLISTPVLVMLYLYLISIPVHAMLYLLFDIWYRYSPCYTYRLLPDTWYSNTWHSTWYCDTWLVTVIPGTCIILHIHDYYFYGNLAWLL